MSVMNQKNILATSAPAPPSLLTQVGMAGTSAVITVSVQDSISSVNRSHFRQMRYGPSTTHRPFLF